MSVLLYSLIIAKPVKAILDQEEISIARTSYICRAGDAYEAEDGFLFSERERKYYAPIKLRLARARNFWDNIELSRRPKYTISSLEKGDEVTEGAEVAEINWDSSDAHLYYDCDPVGKLAGYMHQIGVRGRSRKPTWRVRRHFVEHRTSASWRGRKLREGFYVKGLSRPKDHLGIRCETIEDAEMLVSQLDRAPNSVPPYVEGTLNEAYFEDEAPA